ncbi:AzlD domain-containing protein [Mycetocola spongiae]|uniref:AzlD domain-containing protein n=1 Tax=Mycetocola spongiae TaxID=2859226 RepID=UPI001CF0D779|nr:AzlD domain-containing protein [Mycetocola spongiae]UCR89028.1 AzlD domain-containing protein [Mycetocola spongiae]
MTLWQIVLLASILGLGMKLLGYSLPQWWLERPLIARATDLLTIGLLGALVAVQTTAHADGLILDARLPALAVAAILLAFRVPFLAVVLAAAITAALLRALTGMG